MIKTASDLVYRVDEKQISNRLGLPVLYPIRVFELLGLGTNGLINDLAPTFSMLSWDQYDVKRGQVAVIKRCFPESAQRLDTFLADYYANKVSLHNVGDFIVKMSIEDRWKMERIRPRRKRSIAKFILNRRLSMGDARPYWWEIARVPAQSFSQDAPSEAGDVRALVRVFDEASGLVVSLIYSHDLLRSLAEMVNEVKPRAKQLTITMHQVCIFAELEHDGDNSPEGIHQDGSDYIVSALVVERDGILGGESIVYGPDKKTEYLRHTLLPGQGLFQADKGTPLWHDVTPILEDPATPPTYGKRSILGFDIDVTAED
ncbi:MAG: 2OG-Fe dioxygenase family protein [bacterium]|nr:2OG-Fe dioxygenase family protein [bacterium]